MCQLDISFLFIIWELRQKYKNTRIQKIKYKNKLTNGKNTQIDLLAIVPYYLHLFLITPAGGEAIQLGSLRKIMQVR